MTLKSPVIYIFVAGGSEMWLGQEKGFIERFYKPEMTLLHGKSHIDNF